MPRTSSAERGLTRPPRDNVGNRALVVATESSGLRPWRITKGRFGGQGRSSREIWGGKNEGRRAWGPCIGPASPSDSASLHSKLISNRKGLWKGHGFSSTATFSTDTLAITSPGDRSRSGGFFGGLRRQRRLGKRRSAGERPRRDSNSPKDRLGSARCLQIADSILQPIAAKEP